MNDSIEQTEPPMLATGMGFFRLKYPVIFGDRIHYVIPLKRISIGEAQAYVAEMVAKGLDKFLETHCPVFDCDPELIKHIEADDWFALDQAALEYFPKILRTDLHPPKPAASQLLAAPDALQ